MKITLTTLIFTVTLYLLPFTLFSRVKIVKERFNYRNFAFELTLKNEGREAVKITEVGFDYKAFSSGSIHYFVKPRIPPSIHVKPVANYEMILPWGTRGEKFIEAKPSVYIQPGKKVFFTIGLNTKLPGRNQVYNSSHQLQAQPIVVLNRQDTLYFKMKEITGLDFDNYTEKRIPSDVDLLSSLNSNDDHNRAGVAMYLLKSTLDTSEIEHSFAQLIKDQSARVRKAALPYIREQNYRQFQPQIITNFSKSDDYHETDACIYALKKWEYSGLNELLLARFDTVENQQILLLIAEEIVAIDSSKVKLVLERVNLELPSVLEADLFIDYVGFLNGSEDPNIVSKVCKRFEESKDPGLLSSVLSWFKYHADEDVHPQIFPLITPKFEAYNEPEFLYQAVKWYKYDAFADSIIRLGNVFQNKLEVLDNPRGRITFYQSEVIEELTKLLVKLDHKTGLNAIYKHLTSFHLDYSSHQTVVDGVKRLQDNQTPGYIDSLLRAHKDWSLVDSLQKYYHRILDIPISQCYTESIPLLKELFRDQKFKETQRIIIVKLWENLESGTEGKNIAFARSFKNEVALFVEQETGKYKADALRLYAHLAQLKDNLKSLLSESLQDQEMQVRMVAAEITADQQFYEFAPLLIKNLERSSSTREVKLIYRLLKKFPNSDAKVTNQLLINKVLAADTVESYYYYSNRVLRDFIVDQKDSELNHRVAETLQEYLPCLNGWGDQKCGAKFLELVKILYESEDSAFLPLIRAFIVGTGEEEYLVNVLKILIPKESILYDTIYKNKLLIKLKDHFPPLLKHDQESVRRYALNLYCLTEEDQDHLALKLKEFLLDSRNEDLLYYALRWIKDLKLTSVTSTLKELYKKVSSADLSDQICSTLKILGENCESP